jgi:hypothetical protein
MLTINLIGILHYFCAKIQIINKVNRICYVFLKQYFYIELTQTPKFPVMGIKHKIMEIKFSMILLVEMTHSLLNYSIYTPWLSTCMSTQHGQLLYENTKLSGHF